LSDNLWDLPFCVGLGPTDWTMAAALDHTPRRRSRFLTAVDGIPEYVEFLRPGGVAGDMLRIVTPDVRAFDVIHTRLRQP